MQKAILGKTRSLVGSHRVQDFSIATRHEHVGYTFANRFSLGDREKMLLAFGTGVSDQSSNVEPLRVLENGTGNIDQVVESEFIDEADRSVVSAGQSFCESGAGRHFNLLL